MAVLRERFLHPREIRGVHGRLLILGPECLKQRLHVALLGGAADREVVWRIAFRDRDPLRSEGIRGLRLSELPDAMLLKNGLREFRFPGVDILVGLGAGAEDEACLHGALFHRERLQVEADPVRKRRLLNLKIQVLCRDPGLERLAGENRLPRGGRSPRRHGGKGEVGELHG